MPRTHAQSTHECQNVGVTWDDLSVEVDGATDDFKVNFMP